MNSVLEKPNATLLKKELAFRELARRDLGFFTKYTMRGYEMTNFHKQYCNIVNLFAHGKIKKLIISMPPQHGKSEIATRRLPAFLLGKNPDAKIAIGSYNTTFARKFNRDIQRIIDNKRYSILFPKTYLNESNVISNVKGSYLRNSEEFEIVGKNGFLKAVGRGGALTGSAIDFMILDDLYKNYEEGNSPVWRASVIEWYVTVVRTRLHNQSQQLIVFTRWHEEDLIGFLERTEKVIDLTKKEQLEEIDNNAWYRVNFPAIATADSIANEFDGREKGKALYPSKHSVEKLNADRELSPERFESLYQGDPKPSEGLLYSNFKTYETGTRLKLRKKINYTDTADTGTDYLCSINAGIGFDGYIYILDVFYSQKKAEYTEGEVANLLERGKVDAAYFESNSAGRAFARAVDSILKSKYSIKTFSQKQNKEGRIISNQANVNRLVLMPENWRAKFPEFSKHITSFKTLFKANKHDDAPDALTGILEKSGILKKENVLYQY